MFASRVGATRTYLNFLYVDSPVKSPPFSLDFPAPSAYTVLSESDVEREEERVFKSRCFTCDRAVVKEFGDGRYTQCEECLLLAEKQALLDNAATTAYYAACEQSQTNVSWVNRAMMLMQTEYTAEQLQALATGIEQEGESDGSDSNES